MIDPVGQVADLGGDIVELGLEAGQPVRGRLESWVEAGQSARLAGGQGGRLARAVALGRERLPDGRRSPGDRLAVLGGRQPRPDLLRLARSQPRPGDLRHLVLEEVDPPGQLAWVDRQLGQRGPIGPPPLDDVGHRRAGRGVPAERVEDVALPAFVEQALLVVLAVDLDQRPDLVGETRRRRRQVVEPGGGAPVRRTPRAPR